MREELLGITMLVVAAVIIFVLRPRQGVPVDFIRRSGSDFQALVGLIVTCLLFGGVALMIIGIL